MSGRRTVRALASAATRLDLALALGPRHAAGHRSDVRERARLGNERADHVYERIWRDAAAEVGASATRRGAGVIELSHGGRTTLVQRQVTACDEPEAVERSRDRAAVQHALREAGLPVPEHLEFGLVRLRPARAFLAASDGACVVKPASGTGAGYGITCGVRRRSDLRRAALEATRFAGRLLIERQAPGAMYRILVLDGEVVAAVRRDPPGVTGDGVSSIRALIAAENRRRLEARGDTGLSLVRIDLDCVLALRESRLRLNSVPKAGVRVTVKTSSSDGGEADNETAGDAVGPGLAADAVAAARVAGLRMAGVDVVTVDPSRTLKETAGALVEVNATPGLHHHHLVRDRARAQPAAATVLRHLLR